MHWSALSKLLLLVVGVTQLEAKYEDACTTPHNEAGRCMPVRSCTPFYELLVEQSRQARARPSDERYALIRQSHCGSYEGVHHICCAENDIQLNPVGLQLLQNTTCGHFSTPKVAHGQQADLYAFPWMTLLKYDDNLKPFKCGGSLITERYVLTAAHCVNDELIGVRLGEYDLSTEQDCVRVGREVECSPPVEDIGIEKSIQHGGYKRLFKNDIALLRLNRSVVFKKHIRPICLPITQRLMSKQPDEYYVSGWGYTENHATSNVLMWASLPHQSLVDCEQKLKIRGLDSGQICAGGEERVDSCRGDSGGPLAQLAIFERKLRFTQFGIVSTGVASCGVVSLPGIYTNIAHYMQWITDHMAA